jgi:hypothetical protein
MDWVEIGNTCMMTATNINNPTSPISPISPTNPNSVISQSMSNIMTISDTGTQQSLTEQLASLNTISSTSGSTVQQSTLTPSTTNNESSDKKDNSKVEIPKGKEIVPGFGIVMSMQVLNVGYNMQQQQIQEYINLTQEYEDVRQQNFLIDLIAASDIGDNFNRIADYRWRSLLGNNSLQRSGFSN